MSFFSFWPCPENKTTPKHPTVLWEAAFLLLARYRILQVHEKGRGSGVGKKMVGKPLGFASKKTGSNQMKKN